MFLQTYKLSNMLSMTHKSNTKQKKQRIIKWDERVIDKLQRGLAGGSTSDCTVVRFISMVQVQHRHKLVDMVWGKKNNLLLGVYSQ